MTCATALLLVAVSACAVDRAGLGRDPVDGALVDSSRPRVDLGSGVDAQMPDLATPTDLGTAVDFGSAPDLGARDLGARDLGVDLGVDLGPPPPPCGGRCAAGQACLFEACVACGASLQPCCESDRCQSGFLCVFATGCLACGGSGELCCAGDTCDVGSCRGFRCP